MGDPESQVRQVAFVCPPKLHLLDITGPATIFYEAAFYGAAVQWSFTSLFSGQTESDSSSALGFNRLTPYDRLELQKGDLLFLPGLEYSLFSDRQFMVSCRPFLQWLAAQYRKGVILCSVCTGAFLLAEAGLLDNRECTTHWRYAELFRERFPRATLLSNRLFVEYQGIYSSAGITSGIDLALFLVEKFWGPYIAAQVAKEAVIFFRRTLEDPQLSVFVEYRNHLDYRIHKVQDFLSQSLDRKYSLTELAAQVNMSERNLTRLFKKITRISIGKYQSRLRVEVAEKLLGQGHSLQSAALQCGLKSPGQLRQLLKTRQAAAQPV